ncbi:MAG TPA: hypothetical protein VK208_16310 [Pyrinomonadaceae bacterium]|nr:hypothetical protein [Pyrinomonadaceae bacterium]
MKLQELVIQDLLHADRVFNRAIVKLARQLPLTGQIVQELVTKDPLLAIKRLLRR